MRETAGQRAERGDFGGDRAGEALRRARQKGRRAINHGSDTISARLTLLGQELTDELTSGGLRRVDAESGVFRLIRIVQNRESSRFRVNERV